jgi:hypothetical protein
LEPTFPPLELAELAYPIVFNDLASIFIGSNFVGSSKGFFSNLLSELF